MIGPALPPWQPANNGSGRLRWFLYRGDAVPFRHRWRFNTQGRLVRYVSFQSAERAAARLNAEAAA